MNDVRRHVRGEGGFALAAVIFVLTLLGIMSVGSLALVRGDFQAASGLPESSRAYYAADAGLNLIMANWGSERYDTLVPNPGDTARLNWTTLPVTKARTPRYCSASTTGRTRCTV